MDTFKGIADVLEHVIYETFGLLVPSAVLVFGGAAALGEGAWSNVLAFASDHPAIALGATYLVGYPLQGLSRPLMNVADAIFSAPGRLLREIPRVDDWFNRVEAALGSQHRSVPDRTPDRLMEHAPVDLDVLAAEYWAKRLSLPTAKRLAREQVVSLSFSELLPERRQLDRFRSAASLCRGAAAAVIAVLSILVGQLLFGHFSPSATLFALFAVLVAVFYGLIERANMYSELWRSVVTAQFLRTVTSTGPLPRQEN